MSPDAHELLTDATAARRHAGRLPGRPERPEALVSGKTSASPGSVDRSRPVARLRSSGLLKPCGRPPGLLAAWPPLWLDVAQRPAPSRSDSPRLTAIIPRTLSRP